MTPLLRVSARIADQVDTLSLPALGHGEGHMIQRPIRLKEKVKERGNLKIKRSQKLKCRLEKVLNPSTDQPSMKRLHVSGEVTETSSHESIKPAIESIRRVFVGEMRLLDGGATACMRTAKPHECDMNYPTVKVSLAVGEGQLMISPEGTLLSVERVSPILSDTALRKLGYRIFRDEDVFEVVHKENGQLVIDTSTGCPEVPKSVPPVVRSEWGVE